MTQVRPGRALARETLVLAEIEGLKGALIALMSAKGRIRRERIDQMVLRIRGYLKEMGAPGNPPNYDGVSPDVWLDPLLELYTDGLADGHRLGIQ